MFAEQIFPFCRNNSQGCRETGLAISRCTPGTHGHAHACPRPIYIPLPTPLVPFLSPSLLPPVSVLRTVLRASPSPSDHSNRTLPSFLPRLCISLCGASRQRRRLCLHPLVTYRNSRSPSFSSRFCLRRERKREISLSLSLATDVYMCFSLSLSLWLCSRSLRSASHPLAAFPRSG